MSVHAISSGTSPAPIDAAVDRGDEPVVGESVGEEDRADHGDADRSGQLLEGVEHARCRADLVVGDRARMKSNSGETSMPDARCRAPAAARSASASSVCRPWAAIDLAEPPDPAGQDHARRPAAPRGRSAARAPRRRASAPTAKPNANGASVSRRGSPRSARRTAGTGSGPAACRSSRRRTRRSWPARRCRRGGLKMLGSISGSRPRAAPARLQSDQQREGGDAGGDHQIRPRRPAGLAALDQRVDQQAHAERRPGRCRRGRGSGGRARAGLGHQRGRRRARRSARAAG